MHVVLDDIWKRYTSGWVLKGVSIELLPGQKLALGGSNGSGKSTLLNIISGYLSYTKGSITYSLADKTIDRDHVFRHLAISSASSSLDEEFTVAEIFKHYAKFKPFLISSVDEFVEISDFKKEKNKRVQHFSSGMKQRLSLALAITMNTPFLLLDEPTSFLDEGRKDWFRDTYLKYCKDKTVVIASNDSNDFIDCDLSYNLT